MKAQNKNRVKQPRRQKDVQFEQTEGLSETHPVNHDEGTSEPTGWKRVDIDPANLPDQNSPQPFETVEYGLGDAAAVAAVGLHMTTYLVGGLAASACLARRYHANATLHIQEYILNVEDKVSLRQIQRMKGCRDQETVRRSVAICQDFMEMAGLDKPTAWIAKAFAQEIPSYSIRPREWENIVVETAALNSMLFEVRDALVRLGPTNKHEPDLLRGWVSALEDNGFIPLGSVALEARPSMPDRQAFCDFATALGEATLLRISRLVAAALVSDDKDSPDGGNAGVAMPITSPRLRPTGDAACREEQMLQVA